MKHITYNKLNRGYLKRIPVRVNLKTFWVLSIFSIILLSAVYIFQVNSFTHKARQLSLVQESLEGFLKGNGSLEVELIQKEPSSNLEVLAQNLNFEKIDKIRYINLSGGAVAAK